MGTSEKSQSRQGQLLEGLPDRGGMTTLCAQLTVLSAEDKTADAMEGM